MAQMARSDTMSSANDSRVSIGLDDDARATLEEGMRLTNSQTAAAFYRFAAAYLVRQWGGRRRRIVKPNPEGDRR